MHYFNESNNTRGPRDHNVFLHYNTLLKKCNTLKKTRRITEENTEEAVHKNSIFLEEYTSTFEGNKPIRCFKLNGRKISQRRIKLEKDTSTYKKEVIQIQQNFGRKRYKLAVETNFVQ